jgi:hypothetical protein
LNSAKTLYTSSPSAIGGNPSIVLKLPDSFPAVCGWRSRNEYGVARENAVCARERNHGSENGVEVSTGKREVIARI